MIRILMAGVAVENSDFEAAGTPPEAEKSPAPVAFATGNGSAANAAFATMIGERRSEAEAARFTNAAGALKCTRQGNVESSPARKKVEEFMNEAELCN